MLACWPDISRYRSGGTHFLHGVRDGDGGDGDAVALRNFVQDGRHLFFAAGHHVGSLAAALLWCGAGRSERA